MALSTPFFFLFFSDERYVIKEVSKVELLSFLEFGPFYFEYLCKAYYCQVTFLLNCSIGEVIFYVVSKPLLYSGCPWILSG